MENKLKTAIEHLNLAEFRLPLAKHDAQFGDLSYTEYQDNPEAVKKLTSVYENLLYFGTMLTLSLNDGVTAANLSEQIEVLKNADEANDSELSRLQGELNDVSNVEDSVPTYIRYMFYRAVAMAQNAVVFPYLGLDTWHTDELSQFMQILGKGVSAPGKSPDQS